MEYFVQLFDNGKWVTTGWTIENPGDPVHTESRSKAERCLSRAQFECPTEKYRIKEVAK